MERFWSHEDPGGSGWRSMRVEKDFRTIARMNLSRDIASPKNFQHKAPAFVQQLRITGKPMDLPRNGKAALVMLDAESDQRLLESAAHARVREGIPRGLSEIKVGWMAAKG
jgi:hypothetical protein